MASLRDRFHDWWQRASLAGGYGSADRGDVSAEWQRLHDAWSEPHRAYHTPAHLTECLDLLSLAAPPNELAVEMAIWYHDAVYDTMAHDSEARSADWAAATCRRCHLPNAERVHALILATRHDAVVTEPDAAALVDIDLAILGSAAERFAQYERQIRAEYAWVPEDAFRVGRAAILERFLDRVAIYVSPPFTERFEERARTNLSTTILRLRTPPG